MSQMPQVVLETAQWIEGFLVRGVTPLPELRCVAYELEHPGSGAAIIHLHANDAENLFAVNLATPPADDTGVPHILEHCVLGGSAKYAVKDPFFEMVKCSMATFINAMTGSDYTVYPVASNVRQDFYNLADVYWDAVFHPTLSRATFEREGHHLELAEPGNPRSDLIIKGIVYNEMKGARSSPDSKVMDQIEKALWPDTPYGKDSGGDPEHIPSLTFDEFRQFHQRYYHPENGRILFYGDIPTVEHLRFLAPRLERFQRQQSRATVPLQPRWTAPRNLSDRYAVGPNDPVTGKTFITLSWLVGEATDVDDVLALSALERILLGNQAAPLRKALIDAHLGEDLSHSGFWLNGREASFHVGLMGSESQRTDQVQSLVLDTLRRIADEGVSAEQAQAAFQQMAYHYLQIGSSYPLALMGRVMQQWMHGADPLSALRAGRSLDALKDRFAREPELFSTLIRKRLLENTHRLTLTVTPDPRLQQENDARLAEELRRRKAKMSATELEEVARRQKELNDLLNTPNSPQALAALPQLQVSDLPPQPRHIPTSVERSGRIELLKNDVFANTINYLQVSLDLSHLPGDLWPYLPLYAECIGKLGAAGHDYAAMARRVARHTGGIGFSHAAGTRYDDPAADIRQGTFSIRFLDGEAEPALGVLRDYLFDVDPADTQRLRDVLMQVRAHHRTRPASDGMGLAMRHAGRGFSSAAHLSEIWQGVPQTHLVERLASGNIDALIEKLLAVKAELRRSARAVASFTGTDKIYTQAQETLQNWMGQLDSPAPAATSVAFEPFIGRPREALAAPMNVAYCVSVMPAPHLSNPQAPLLAVGARLVSYGYVLEEVRFKGTAYGGGCSYGAGSSTFEFHSYRDPWIHRTLDVYARATDFVRNADWSKADVDRAIIGTAKEFERPIRPADATGTALWRYLLGDTKQLREARHAAMLAATPAAVRKSVLETFEAGFPRAAVCVVTSKEKLDAANAERPEGALVIEEILPARG